MAISIGRDMKILVIGGTRNVGHHLVTTLLGRDHDVTTFNRGETPDDLPGGIERLHGDRTDPAALARAVRHRDFDACIDTIAMRGTDTAAAIEALDGRVGHYVHVSTGQVYLVRAGCPVPAREDDYDGLLIDPPNEAWEAAEWRYGMEKRECEDRLAEASTARGFPSTRLRLPMIHGPRDHHGRIHGLVLRLTDGGPLLVPLMGGPKIRHIHANDVAEAIVSIVERGLAVGEAINLAPDDLVSLHDWIETVADAIGAEPDIVRIPRDELVEEGVFPACCPFANPWMSVLDNGRAKELGLSFRSNDAWLPELANRFVDTDRPPPPAYAEQRGREREIGAA